ncbi:PQ-loop-domain-containing protein [Mycena venus]|uniref:PQ-loop-domain-containing protein n=1 Tax=Mycena venus TaxID=2733690 RepID=A0A8H6Y8B9_9AGAR|nr:PQ-loop-domain-containing protein [Mycena venus]
MSLIWVSPLKRSRIRCQEFSPFSPSPFRLDHLPARNHPAMRANPIAENVFGTMGTICWTVQVTPQVWKTWREKSTEGLSPWLVLTWGISTAFLGAYTIILDLSIPLVLEPHFFGFLCLVSWGQVLPILRRQALIHHIHRTRTRRHARHRRPRSGARPRRAPRVRRGQRARAARATDFFGLFGSALIGLGLAPQYVEIWRRREVVGISRVLLVLDMLGGVFMDLSLAFHDNFNVVAGITYSLIVPANSTSDPNQVLETIVLLAALILNPRAEKRRQRVASETGEKAADIRPRPALLSAAGVGSSWSTVKVDVGELRDEVGVLGSGTAVRDVAGRERDAVENEV